MRELPLSLSATPPHLIPPTPPQPPHPVPPHPAPPIAACALLLQSPYSPVCNETKTEMLRLQPTSPSAASTTPVAPSQTASAAATAAPPRRGAPPLSSTLKVVVPSTPPTWFSKVGMPTTSSSTTPTTERGAGDKLEASLIAAQTQKGAYSNAVDAPFSRSAVPPRR